MFWFVFNLFDCLTAPLGHIFMSPCFHISALNCTMLLQSFYQQSYKNSNSTYNKLELSFDSGVKGQVEFLLTIEMGSSN